MNRFDSIYKKNNSVVRIQDSKQKTRLLAPGLYYFYKSLQIVLMMWILLLAVIIISPWTNYFIKKNIAQTEEPKVLGAQKVATVVKPVVVAPTFYFKKNDLEIKAPIVNGISDEDLTKGIGHHPESVWPNQKGNVVIAGHSFSLNADNPFREVFARLREIEIGDQVTVTYQNRKYTYKVFKKETVSAKDTSLMEPTDNWILTFYTCDPPKTDWRRLVLQAELVRIE